MLGQPKWIPKGHQRPPAAHATTLNWARAQARNEGLPLVASPSQALPEPEHSLASWILHDWLYALVDRGDVDLAPDISSLRFLESAIPRVLHLLDGGRAEHLGDWLVDQPQVLECYASDETLAAELEASAEQRLRPR